MNKLRLLLIAGLCCTPLSAFAQGSTLVLPLLQAANRSGNVISNVPGGNYNFNLAGTVGSATITVTDSDSAGVQHTLATFSAIGDQCLAIPANVSMQATVAGGTPSGLYLTARGVQACPSSGGSGSNASVGTNGSTVPTSSTQIGVVVGGNLQPASASNPVPVSGTFSATLAGFAPVAGAIANLSVTTSSADVALPAGTSVVVTNSGAADAAFRIQVGAGTALTTDQILKSGAAAGITVGSNTHLSAITATGSTTLNIQGGSGLATGYGGGGGSSGGNAAASATGSAVPASADYTGLNVGGTLRGQTGTNPSSSIYAAGIDIQAILGTAPSLTNPIWIANAETADSTGTFTNATQTTSVTNSTADGYATGLLSINGTYTTATGVFEVSDDGGTTWYSVNCARSDGTASETGYTTLTNVNRQWTCPVSGNDSVRVRSTAVATGTVNARVGVSAPSTASGTTVNLGTGSAVQVTNLRYQLAGTYAGSGSTSGTPAAVGPVLPGSYILSCSGTIGGGTITLQVLGPDGATFQTVSGISFTSLPSSIGVVLGGIVSFSGPNVTAANVKVVNTGATSPSYFCSLS